MSRLKLDGKLVEIDYQTKVSLHGSATCRYEVFKEIGQGAFAIIYQARDTELDRLVVLKELRPVLLHNAEWVRCFRREARAIARLDHPQIVIIYDVK